MKRFRFRISTLCWLVATVAVFLAGIRYGEYRVASRGKPAVYRAMRPHGRWRVSSGPASAPAIAKWRLSELDQP
jgi:hypothetical protein